MRISTMLVLLFIAAARINAAAVDHPLPDMTVRTAYGDFVFTKMEIRSQVGSLGKEAHFIGAIENRTGHNWIGVAFSLEVTDAKAKKFDSRRSASAFEYAEFAKGEIKPFNYGPVWLFFSVVVQNSFGLNPTINPGTLAVQNISLKVGDVRATYRFALESPANSEHTSYDDDFISATLYPAETQLGFVVRNKSSEPIKVLWDQCSYIDPSGQTLRVIHSGIRMIQKDAPMSPSVIPPGASLKEAITPADYITYVGGEVGWSVKQMFPMRFVQAIPLKGSAVSMFMPIEIKGSTRNYTFTLRAKDIVPDAGVPNAPTIPAPTANPTIELVTANSEAAKDSPAAAAALASVGHAQSPQELADLVQKGQASRCAVVTVPPGAEVLVDGNRLGVSPLAFVLLRQGDTPRTVTIKMSGYETVEKKLVPDGKTIPIALTLKKE
jgi:hypothetical protein